MRNLEPSDPAQVGSYRMLGRLGEGGMGRVYLARSDLGRTVAVKLVQPDLARLPEFRQRFRQEVSVSQRVTGQWTASVLDADTEAEQPWVATGYVPGPSLHSVVTEEYGPLPTEALRVLAHGLTLALSEVHGVGLIHRDLKPANVLVTIDGPRLIDFGIARAVETATGSDLTRTGAVVGSPGFLSPEQVRGEPVSPASDVFALGCVLAFAAGGRSPFGTAEGGQHALLFRVAEHAPDLRTVPAEWHEFIGACLEKAPERRPTVDQLLEGSRPAESAGSAPWLPATLIASLGRHAAALLERETPLPHAGSAPPAGAPGGAPGSAPSQVPGATPSPAPGPAPSPLPGPAPSPVPGSMQAAALPDGAMANSLFRQASTGQETIRISSRLATSSRFAQLAYRSEQLGYGYDNFRAGITKSPTLTLRRFAVPPAGPTPLDLLTSRIKVDGMAAYTRTLIVLLCAAAAVLFGPAGGGTPLSVIGNIFLFGVIGTVAFVTMRRRERAQTVKLSAHGYQLLPGPEGGAPRYQPANQNPATPPPWGSPGGSSPGGSNPGGSSPGESHPGGSSPGGHRA